MYIFVRFLEYFLDSITVDYNKNLQKSILAFSEESN